MQHAFRELVADLGRRGRSVLLSSHVIAEVEAVCSRVAILRAGSVVALESIETLRDSVVRRARIRFRGAPPHALATTPASRARTSMAPTLCSAYVATSTRCCVHWRAPTWNGSCSRSPSWRTSF